MKLNNKKLLFNDYIKKFTELNSFTERAVLLKQNYQNTCEYNNHAHFFIDELIQLERMCKSGIAFGLGYHGGLTSQEWKVEYEDCKKAKCILKKILDIE